jgi:RNA polymerase sigma factor (sigma-70 family)
MNGIAASSRIRLLRERKNKGRAFRTALSERDMNDDGRPLAGAGRAAEPEGFTQLVRDHYGPALRYARRLLRSDSEAEDAVQEAFAEAYSGLRALRRPEALAAWLRGIVRHRCLRRLRRHDFELAPLPPGDTLGDDMPGSEPHAGRDQRAFASALLTALPAHEREIVILFYLKECSQQEIASFLGLPVSTVNNRLHDARQRMKHWEERMHQNTTTLDPHEALRVSRIGTLLSCSGPIVEARFDSELPIDLFDAVVVAGADGKAMERMKVCHRLGDGRVHCLLTQRPELPLEPGIALLNTGKLALDLTPYRRVPGVSSDTLRAAIEVLRGSATQRDHMLTTGIKAVDLLCPLAAGGVAIQVGMAGVGRVVLLEELARRLEHSHAPITLLCLVERSEPDPYRGWEESELCGRVADTRFYWALAEQGTDPELPALDAAEAVLYMTPLLALKGLYPALDAEHSRSRLLRPEVVGHEHCALAARARDALLLCKRAEADPMLLELLATRAYAAARRRQRTLESTNAGTEPIVLQRARKLRAFLSQPFGVASEVTGWPGVSVPLPDTLDGCRAILDGAVDELPTSAFAYAGTLEDVREHARAGVARVYH